MNQASASSQGNSSTSMLSAIEPFQYLTQRTKNILVEILHVWRLVLALIATVRFRREKREMKDIARAKEQRSDPKPRLTAQTMKWDLSL
jgi:hypothetical protein